MHGAFKALEISRGFERFRKRDLDHLLCDVTTFKSSLLFKWIQDLDFYDFQGFT